MKNTKDELGQGLIEYAMIAAFIAIVVIGAITMLGNTIKDNWYQFINDNLPF